MISSNHGFEALETDGSRGWNQKVYVRDEY
jgi:hypothetical protein